MSSLRYPFQTAILNAHSISVNTCNVRGRVDCNERRYVQVNEATSDAQDLRISMASSSSRPQQPQQDPTVTHQPPVVTVPTPSITLPPDSAPPPPPPTFGLGLIAVGPHTSLGVVPTTPANNTGCTDGGAALNIPTVRQSSQSGASSSGAGGGPVGLRRRVSDKTWLPLSTGSVFSHMLYMFHCSYITSFAETLNC